MTGRLPNFFLAGAPKAGTTSLYHYLDQHPQVFMSPIKEPNFFAEEVREQNFAPSLRRDIARDARSLRRYLDGPMRERRLGGIVAEWEDYGRLFAGATTETALGEASVCYLWSPAAPERIAGAIPEARILVMLRDPAERAFSQYLHGLGNGSIRWSFREHIRRNRNHGSGELCAHYPFLEFGMYAEPVRRYRERFGSRFWVGFHEDFAARPLDVYGEICRFLGLSASFEPSMGRRHLEGQVPRAGFVATLKRLGVWRAAANMMPRGLRPLARRALVRRPGAIRIEPADRRYLVDFYGDDIRRLADILGRDLSAWLRTE